jgi:hypothetical protein
VKKLTRDELHARVEHMTARALAGMEPCPNSDRPELDAALWPIVAAVTEVMTKRPAAKA